ncbi:hypothetical protein ES288_D09G131700v1 [Gossypium darwinii]|uniref:F-box/LRR-repeat protein 15-like leucin rich repeat domain-containing protein n=1 Tax=Gossypium darwinii TaxID=34276 RepID=A0A5D2BDD8_GOSDA|nr:hypothetical protein ES288_D09G131700v1 [Gossypium darwinii]
MDLHRVYAVKEEQKKKEKKRKLSIRGSNSVLSLWNVLRGDEGLCKIDKECHLLEKLDLCRCPHVSNKGLIAIVANCPNLTTLSIESCPKIGNEGLQAIEKLYPKLQSISIKDCPLVGDHGVSSLLSSASSILLKVKLQGLSISDFSLAMIGHYGKPVINLMLSGLQNVSKKGFRVMGNAQGLQKLVYFTIASCWEKLICAFAGVASFLVMDWWLLPSLLVLLSACSWRSATGSLNPELSVFSQTRFLVVFNPVNRFLNSFSNPKMIFESITNPKPYF